VAERAVGPRRILAFGLNIALAQEFPRDRTTARRIGRPHRYRPPGKRRPPTGRTLPSESLL